jgi:pyrroline-5-carboxylate reductase
MRTEPVQPAKLTPRCTAHGRPSTGLPIPLTEAKPFNVYEIPPLAAPKRSRDARRFTTFRHSTSSSPAPPAARPPTLRGRHARSEEFSHRARDGICTFPFPYRLLKDSPMPAKWTLGFIGTGQMATALAQGFIRAGQLRPAQILGSDPNPEARKRFSQATGARVVPRNKDLLESAQLLVLATKPDQVSPVLEELRDGITARHLLISIAAGIPVARLESLLPPRTRVIRVMPNTPALVGASATAFCPGHSATRADEALVQRLFSALGLALPIKESLMDAVTGLSGSGPAYVCAFLEAITDGGVACGLPRDTARQLALQTLLGTARMLTETGLHPTTLKEMVTSPGGTTIEGLQVLAEGGFHGTVMRAVRAAADKAKRLAQTASSV